MTLTAKEQLWTKAYQIIMTANNKTEARACLCSLMNLQTKENVTEKKANKWISKFWKKRKHNLCREFC